MVTVNYQTFGKCAFQLRLRIYKDGETKYINVTKMLKGSIQKKHWNKKKQQFIPSCPFSKENNEMLVKFRQRYDEAAIGWKGSVYGLLASMDGNDEQKTEGITLKQFIFKVIDDLKAVRHSDGTIKGSYENYIKLDKRLDEYCKHKRIKYDKIRLSEVNADFVNQMFDWVLNVRKGVGYIYISKQMHSVLMKADKENLLNWNDFKNCKWSKKKLVGTQKYNTLTSDQCRRFIALTRAELPKNVNSELYHDFCTFILFTGQSRCDAITLKYSDIKNIGGTDHFIFKRRKIAEKQANPCAVPINKIMWDIMDKWKARSRDGYIFPIRNKQKLESQITNNGDIKHFICRLNLWLKKVGEIIGCDFPLHTYTFRHTAITHYISKGVPVIYVANLMGTSVKNCESIYYNNQGDTVSRDKVLSVTF